MPNIELNSEPEEEVVRHTLDLDELNEEKPRKKDNPKEIDEMDLIPTTELLRNIRVEYQEVLIEETTVEELESDFIITDMTPDSQEDNFVEEPAEEEQITLTFDLPINQVRKEKKSKDDIIKFDLDEKVKDIKVKDYIELIPVTEANDAGETHYALDNYIELESSMNTKMGSSSNSEMEVEEEVIFEKKVIEKQKEPQEQSEEIDPFNSPISEILKERAAERRRKMKDFNYKFNTSKIDDIEREPAYKRQGIELNNTKHSSDNSASRTSVSLDENDEIQLRSNNSFLHDNVD
jgi:cell division protein FtsZ